ncbi:hypothetical protein KCP91_08115 [Microvirga sp. SRT01]|uniref:DUF2214 domain-containing protein n=1 Tax=Sphingomonas longa TaxID=2778730 RepID=A0ABS2D5Y5_9SPHN|nr:MULTISPECIES: hypothetical protein [Alphaproteobacteria]MBM6576335.1 hypothetical protein [Sphingomonas sp. BT552]MBR7709381.1 hypothetical protein [Microvirga sp. SRT01]
MQNSSFAAQAVADGPQTIAPPSFNGMGWLVVTNLAVMTIATLIGIMVIVKLAGDAIQHRRRDTWLSPAWIYRTLGILFACGITLRCGAEAVNLWGWNPHDPIATGMYLTAKRLIDPIAVAFGVTALMTFILSEPGMIEQQRKEPWPVDMWLAWPMVKRMLWLAVLTVAAAAGVVSTR